MRIEELLERYFEGETSCEEEQELRRFFIGKNVPEHLQMYCSFFRSLHEEVKVVRKEQLKPRNKKVFLHRLMYSACGIAAGVMLFVGIGQLFQTEDPLAPKDYVIINGKRYTDAKLVQQEAINAFKDMKMTEDDMLNLMFE